MAGLKESILQDQPVSFWTFDFDQNFINGDLIIDEIGNANPMVCQNDVNGANYELEQQSLNEIEHADQYAIAIAKNQKVDGLWLNQFFEAVHTTAYDFPDLGQFTVEFLYYKASPDEIRNFGEPGYNSTITTPLVSKGSVFSASIVDVWNSTDYLTVSVLGRTITINQNQYPIFDRINHVVVAYRVNQTDVNEYESTVELWLNGRLWGSNTQQHVDTVPVTSTSASWLFAGDGGTDPRSDYATELLKLDQIAVYQYALTHQQIANHYRKTKQYDAMIVDDYPQRYWRLDELSNPSDTSLNPTVGGINGEYIGAVNRYSPGPDRIITAHAPFFQSGGLAYIDHYDSLSRFSPVITTSGSFTLEFWFRSDSNNRGMLFDCTEETPPRWDGLRVYLNSKNGAHTPGNLQVYHTDDGFINSLDTDALGDRYNFNDDLWHHLALTYNDSTSTMELWLDGVSHGTTIVTNYAIDKPGQITLMNSRPGDAPIQGFMCELAFYQYALQDTQIYNRWVFSTRYKVSGYTLLQGAPAQALVRFYDTITGEFVDEVTSDGVTGEYTFYPENNRYLDVVSRLPGSSTTRYRVHGPVKPAEYDDSHLQ